MVVEPAGSPNLMAVKTLYRQQRSFQILSVIVEDLSFFYQRGVCELYVREAFEAISKYQSQYLQSARIAGKVAKLVIFVAFYFTRRWTATKLNAVFR